MADNDSFTEVTSTSWTSRIGDSFKGIGIGIILIIIASALLYWNEGRTVRSGDAIAEAQRVTVPLPSITTVDPGFNGKTVYTSGPVTTKEILVDDMFGVKTTAISLTRKVQYYQWVESSRSETRKKLGGGEETVTTYSYVPKWVDAPVDSQQFKRPQGHENTVNVTVKPETWYSDFVKLGAYRLPAFFIQSISGEKALDTGLTEVQQLELQKSFFPDYAMGESLGDMFGSAPVDMMNNEKTPMVHVRGNMLYLGRKVNNPSVGDVQVTYFAVPPTATVSLIGKVSGDTFEQFRASNGKMFSALEMGVVSVENMFQDAKDSNNMIAWALRVVGVLIAMAGFRAIVAPLAVIADVIPLLGTLVGAGTGLVASLLGFAWSLIVIAVAWLRFRPILACSLLGGAVVLFVLLLILGKGRKSKAPAA